MNKQIASACAAALLALAALPVQAQNVAIVNGKPVPTSRVDALAAQIAKSGRPVTPDLNAQIKEEARVQSQWLCCTATGRTATPWRRASCTSCAGP